MGVLVQSRAETVEVYLAELPESRRTAIERVRDTILENLPEGYDEGMLWGMIAYYVPLGRYPDTYNVRPLTMAALANQKNYMALYLMGANAERDSRFREEYRKRGKRLDMGKSCVRFRSLDDLPLDLVGGVIAATPVDEFLRLYEASRRR
jgi:hypothetical protein